MINTSPLENIKKLNSTVFLNYGVMTQITRIYMVDKSVLFFNCNLSKNECDICTYSGEQAHELELYLKGIGYNDPISIGLLCSRN